jgi:hypothetical protein
MENEITHGRLEQIHYDIGGVWGEATIPGTGEHSLGHIIMHTLARLPEAVYDELMHGEISLIFVGCGPGQLGEAFRWYKPVPPGAKAVETNVILLSGELCRQPLEEAMFTVAHELAHHHLGGNGGVEVEKAADDLAMSWGFARPQ